MAYQGNLGGHCGPYAIVNAFDRCGLDQEWLGRNLFKIACLAIEGWPRTLWKGTDFPQMKTMLKACTKASKNAYREAGKEFHVKVECPFWGAARPRSDREYWRRLNEIFACDDVVCGILWIEHPWRHWIVFRNSGESLIMFDSCVGATRWRIAKPNRGRSRTMTEQLTCWETTRLSKHFILLDFMADHTVYRSCRRLAFDETWKKHDEHDALARGLCNDLLEPLMMDKRFGPISVADAFWPAVFKGGHHPSAGPKHRWTGGEATVDIALYRLVDDGKTDAALKKAVEDVKAIDDCRDRVISYRKTEFLCVTFKVKGAKLCGEPNTDLNKSQKLRAHHVRVGRYFNLLDFCRSGRAVEEGIDLVPKGIDEISARDYSPVPEEAAARSFAAALDPLVERIGRISVVRGMETARFAASDEHAHRHRWDRYGPWRLVFVLPQETDPEEVRELLLTHPHVRDVQTFRHPSDSHAVALIVDRTDYDKYRGLRLLPV